ncbi:MAG TPA: cytochrome c oxidase subunit II, partial [Chloroflexota bacterium]|nr:cytochrome c oxidase subunit II [Chloroflexota bacterium]
MIDLSRNRSLIRRALACLGVLSVFLLAGCQTDPQTTLAPTTHFADDIQFLLKLTFFAACGVFFVVEGALVYILFRYRRRRTDPAMPPQIHGNTPVEIIWTIIPAVLLAVVAAYTIPIIFSTQAPPPQNSLPITVVGHQWWWEFDYPTLGVTTANEVHMPVGQTAAFTLDSADVMHSFWLPRLGGKRDVIPNHANTLWWAPNEIGTTPGQCAQFCGTSHANMRMIAVVQSQSDFNSWVAAQKAAPAQPTDGAAADGRAVFARS